MTRTKEIYVFEEDGKHYITDQYDLNRVVFPNRVALDKWIAGFEPATGKKPIVIEHKPDIMANLARGT